MTSGHSTTIEYYGSGLKYIIDQFKLEAIEGYDSYKIPEGIKAIFITSLASIIEGTLKSFLKEFLKNLNIQNITIEDNQQVQPIIEPTIERDKIDMLKDICEDRIKRIENSTFENLLKEFELVTSVKLKELLDNQKENLFDNVKAIFRFRNLFIHGNVIEIEFLEENSFKFTGKSELLHNYLKKHDLEKEDYIVGDHFIELLVTKKLLNHFKDVVFNHFLKLEFWNDTPLTKNMINRIYYENDL